LLTKENGEEFILRLTPRTHQSPQQVIAEVDWVNDLAERDVPVAAVVPAMDGSLCQAVELAGEHFTAVSFQKVRGEIGSGNYWTTDTFIEWGRLASRLHRESRRYQPGFGRSRASWVDRLPAVVPDSVDDEIAMERLAQVAARLNSLPKSPDAYGLIHADFHFWNFAVSPTGLTAFDFDNCEYNWFVADLGTVVFEGGDVRPPEITSRRIYQGILG
jgi:Ser/Thr protein kinase RdoA (MazF antagonist)